MPEPVRPEAAVAEGTWELECESANLLPFLVANSESPQRIHALDHLQPDTRRNLSVRDVRGVAEALSISFAQWHPVDLDQDTKRYGRDITSHARFASVARDAETHASLLAGTRTLSILLWRLVTSFLVKELQGGPVLSATVPFSWEELDARYRGDEELLGMLSAALHR